MIPVPVAVVCPKTCGTLAEDASIIVSHSPIGYICQEADPSENQLVQLGSAKFSISWVEEFLFAGHSNVQLASVCGKGLLETGSKAVPLQASIVELNLQNT